MCIICTGSHLSEKLQKGSGVSASSTAVHSSDFCSRHPPETPPSQAITACHLLDTSLQSASSLISLQDLTSLIALVPLETPPIAYGYHFPHGHLTSLTALFQWFSVALLMVLYLVLEMVLSLWFISLCLALYTSLGHLICS